TTNIHMYLQSTYFPFSFTMSPYPLFFCCSLATIFFFSTNSEAGPYNAIFSFGDSLADTGNYIRSGSLAFPVIAKLPYGETFFKHATGRCSDGRLVVDFIAEAYGLPLLPPYLERSEGQDFRTGANFAMAGATALDVKYFYEQKLGALLWSNKSLSDQLVWFKELKSSLCTTEKECKDYFRKSLFIVGEIGGNDYNYPLLVGRGIKQIRTWVPLVVDSIARATSMLIEEGAVEVLVPGNLPIGCSAVFLTIYGSANKSDYDSRNGCLRSFNMFSKYHNSELKIALDNLRARYPHAKIIYADYYGAAHRFFHSPLQYGFKSGTLTACCGGGGPYNFNITARCGHIGSKACSDPSTHANWDGIHLTEASYKLIATGILNGPHSSPPMRSPYS
ncbi:hypothetical protein IFM89_019533, partial [Coptis chinensis]